uniref:uncharacterized protein LOC112433384 n=1 Tax=Maylandia zebra TaxID=106582 RepID=UPI000D3025AC|nr:uncharacterized protein LOC112433384 [Maylandia zebra]
MILQAAVLSVFLCFAHTFVIEAPFKKSVENSGNNTEGDDFSISTLLEKANANLGKNLDEPLVIFGDIAVPTGLQNADPCTARGCLWPKNNGRVVVPYRISDQYCKSRYMETFLFIELSANFSGLTERTPTGMEHNFRKINTRNLDTPYDYNSVMHYGRFAFSRDREPTIVPIPDENVAIGRATEMSANDILRVNRLYTCSMYLVSFRFFFFPFL